MAEWPSAVKTYSLASHLAFMRLARACNMFRLLSCSILRVAFLRAAALGASAAGRTGGGPGHEGGQDEARGYQGDCAGGTSRPPRPGRRQGPHWR
jgi:hypothetical protein